MQARWLDGHGQTLTHTQTSCLRSIVLFAQNRMQYFCATALAADEGDVNDPNDFINTKHFRVQTMFVHVQLCNSSPAIFLFRITQNKRFVFAFSFCIISSFPTLSRTLGPIETYTHLTHISTCNNM